MTPEELERELAALQGLSTQALQAKWRDVFKSNPPRKMRAGFLHRAIAYRLQETVFGGLKPATKREMERLALAVRNARTPEMGDQNAARSPLSKRRLAPGTRLIREWNGKTELVEVVSDGLVWRDKTFRTLSAVALAITGTKWSGPKFFGLVEKVSSGARSAPTRKAPHRNSSEEVA